MEESGDGIGDRRKWKEVRNLVRNLVVKRFRDPVLWSLDDSPSLVQCSPL